MFSPFIAEFKPIAEITEFICGNVHIGMSDVPIPSPALFPQNLAEPRGNEQTHVSERCGLRLRNDPDSKGIVFKKGSVINLTQTSQGDPVINPNR